MLALGAGQFLGQEGPFVHLSSIVTNGLMSLSFFRSLRMNAAVTHQLFSAAVTAGFFFFLIFFFFVLFCFDFFFFFCFCFYYILLYFVLFYSIY